MNNLWKPRKKTLTIIAILFILTIFFIWFNQDKKYLPLLAKEDFITANTEDISGKDSDKDGVHDWEEFLWGLDPNSKDTDNNGVTDDKELETKKTALRGTATTTPSSTLTDAFSKEFFVAFSALKQSGNLTPTNIDKLSQQSILTLTQTTIKDTYTQKDLVVTSSNPESNTAYKKAIEATGKGLAITKLGKELELLTRAINKPRSSKLIEELSKIQQIYLTLAERTIKVPTPSAIQNSHLDLANTYYKLGAAVGGLTQIYDDPALSVVYFSEYRKALEKLSIAMNAIGKYSN